MRNVGERGVDVTNNRCKGPDIALESLVYLQANAHVRLESPDVLKRQLICQNQAPFPLKIRLIGAASPWIRPEQNIIHCEDWQDDRLECHELWSGKVALVCATTGSDKALAALDNSVKMRGPDSDDSGQDDTSMDILMQSVNSLLKRDIKPKIDQCRRSFNAKQAIKLSWKIIKSTGIVLVTAKPEVNDEDKFVECVIDTLEDYPFPRFQVDIPVTHEF